MGTRIPAASKKISRHAGVVEHYRAAGSMIVVVAAPGRARGAQQPGRTDSFRRKQNEAVRPSVLLLPGTPEREAYEWLVANKGVSGAEVIRQALVELRKQESSKPPLQEAG
jgi:hypothetical protein